MRWLHRFLDDRHQLLTQLGEIHLIAEGGAESGEGLGSIILVAIEAVVDDVLDALA